VNVNLYDDGKANVNGNHPDNSNGNLRVFRVSDIHLFLSERTLLQGEVFLLRAI